MDSGVGWLLAVAVAACVVSAAALLAGVVVARSSRRARARLEDELAASREELQAVQKRLDGLARRVEPARSARSTDEEFVITTAGLPEPRRDDHPDHHDSVAPSAVPDRQLTAGEFTSVALGESLVTLASLAYGVRRALSPENRNRIAFEMRREVRRARKQRKADLKEAQEGTEAGLNLGAIALRGESGALVLSLGAFSRLRSNPFFGVVRAKILETLARDEPQHLHRIVGGRAPELVVEIAKHLTWHGLPTPPEVGSELVEASNTFRKGRKASVPSHRTIDRSRPRSVASMKLHRSLRNAPASSEPSRGPP